MIQDSRIKIVKWLVLGLLGIVLGLVFNLPDKRLHVMFCDVGQGDAILIKLGRQQVLVDGGKNDMVLDCLSQYVPFWDRKIEMIIMTNADSDHMGGLIDVLQNYEVEKVVANHLYKDSDRFKVFRKAVGEEGVEVFAPKRGDRLVIRSDLTLLRSDLAELEFQVLWPDDRLGNSLVWLDSVGALVLGENTYSKSKGNEQSVVLKLSWGDFEVLLTGDVGIETEDKLLEMGLLDDIEVLKVGHHGSGGSSGEEFLKVIDPEIGIVSVGKNNYGHPTEEVLDRLEDEGVEVLRTDLLGDIEIVSDGSRYWVK